MDKGKDGRLTARGARVIVVGMAQLLVRKVPGSLVEKLKRRAAEHGISAEEEHRRILAEALRGPGPAAPPTFKEHLAAMPAVGEDWLFDLSDARHGIPV